MNAIARIEQLLRQAIVLLETQGHDYKVTDLRIRLLELMEAPTVKTKQSVASSLEQVLGRLRGWHENPFDRLYMAVTGERAPSGPVVSIPAPRLSDDECSIVCLCRTIGGAKHFRFQLGRD